MILTVPEIPLHLEWLKTENEKYNLTTVPQERWWERHILDSCVPLLAGWELGESMLDLGTGGGFPGLPLFYSCTERATTGGCPYNTFRLILLDSRQKVVTGLNRLLTTLSVEAHSRAPLQGEHPSGGTPGLWKGTAVWERAENLARQDSYREQFDRVVTRAVAPLAVLVELGIPFLNKRGELWCWKSDLNEVPGATHVLEELHAKIQDALEYRLPSEEQSRYIMRIIRKGELNPRYPRKAGIPQKRPL
jgi:16S rRNA (guanine527-N7)-methyltransferase